VEKPSRTALIYDEKYLEHIRRFGHLESPERLETAMKSLEKYSLLRKGSSRVFKPRLATVEEVAAVHDPSYIKEIREYCRQGGGYYDGDTPLSPESYEVALLAAGGMFSRPPRWHLRSYPRRPLCWFLRLQQCGHRCILPPQGEVGWEGRDS